MALAGRLVVAQASAGALLGSLRGARAVAPSHRRACQPRCGLGVEPIGLRGTAERDPDRHAFVLLCDRAPVLVG